MVRFSSQFLIRFRMIWVKSNMMLCWTVSTFTSWKSNGNCVLLLLYIACCDGSPACFRPNMLTIIPITFSICIAQELQLHLGVLQQHAALIGGPNATSCPICHKLFLGADALMEHMKHTHKDPNANAGATSKYLILILPIRSDPFWFLMLKWTGLATNHKQQQQKMPTDKTLCAFHQKRFIGRTVDTEKKFIRAVVFISALFFRVFCFFIHYWSSKTSHRQSSVSCMR